MEPTVLLEPRTEKLIAKMKEKDFDGVIIFPGSSMYYLTGLKLKPSERITFVLIRKTGEKIFVLPEVEKDKMTNIKFNNLFIYKDDPLTAITQLKIHVDLLGKIGFEANSVRMFEYQSINHLATNFSNFDEEIENLRMIKEDYEINSMKKAVQIIEDSLTATLDFIKPGKTEREVASHLEYEMRKRGAEGFPFETIVASGYRGALPHGRASEKIIESGEFVVLDFGAIYNGYAADITRTIGIGNVKTAWVNIYNIVKTAQEYAINTVKPGITAEEVDHAARDVITSAGYGTYFTHRTGHGIGVDCHEAPYIRAGNSVKLQPNMTFTIEPGIYIPGELGVRIEDDVVVTENGVMNLMTFTRELIIL